MERLIRAAGTLALLTALLVPLGCATDVTGPGPVVSQPAAKPGKSQGNDKVPIIHKGKRILIAASAVPAHLAHGDHYAIYKITTAADEGGAIDPAGPVEVGYGEDQAFAILANVGYTIGDVLVDGTSVGPVTEYNFTDVDADHVLAATFLPVPEFTLTITANTTGMLAVSPLGEVPVTEGGSLTLTLTPDCSWIAAGVAIDGAAPILVDLSGSGGTYTLENVTQDHSIVVTVVGSACGGGGPSF